MSNCDHCKGADATVAAHQFKTNCGFHQFELGVGTQQALHTKNDGVIKHRTAGKAVARLRNHIKVKSVGADPCLIKSGGHHHVLMIE
jgi:hypothetical protein